MLNPLRYGLPSFGSWAQPQVVPMVWCRFAMIAALG
jgi:hypothetical protein